MEDQMSNIKERETKSMEGGMWGMVVVFAAFTIQVIVFGTSQSIGLYNIEFLRTFDTGAAAVSLVGSINLGMLLGAGPICSILMAKWSHRQVALLGAALCNIGLIFMPFAPNLPYMYAFYGILGGLGYSLTYVPSHILSGLYYSKHRSLSTGVATAGSGLGAVIDNLGYQEPAIFISGAFTLFGGIVMCVVPLSRCCRKQDNKQTTDLTISVNKTV